jgi:hypothetical protein
MAIDHGQAHDVARLVTGRGVIRGLIGQIVPEWLHAALVNEGLGRHA